uniref:Centriolar and ciliogenesis-associated protein HYLS1 C-terminal domain-containing protein n=2 Tax=Octopus bimaculoides TaxID=37653 RepID=A0A0L8GPJ0_OCTBM|eukprot:XP_014779145.1 PREDICTED: uncharacterized protein LOC106875489 [Octopus bimaculoides]
MASDVSKSRLDFTEEEIRKELFRYGIKDINQSSLCQFQKELKNLVKKITSSSLRNVDKSTSISSSFNNITDTCLKMSPSSPPEPISITSPSFTSRTAKNVDDKSCLPHTGDRRSVNSMDPSSVTVSHNRPQNTAESSQLFNSANKVDGHSEMTLSHQYTHTQQPLTNRSETEHEKQENLLRTFARTNVPQPNQVNSFDKPKNKENVWTRHIAPSSSSSSLSSQESVPKPSQIDTGKPPLLNTHVTKRKVSRKGPDGKRYIDKSESVCSISTTSSICGSCCSSIVDPAEYQNRLREITNRDGQFCQRSQSSCDSRFRSSIIVTPTPPRLKKNRKTDPVSRFHEFQNYWNMHKPPGENNHNALRWSIKEKIAKHDVIGSRPRKTFVPNNYVIPSQKPRHSLRWQVRTDLAYGVMPSTRYNDN